MIKGFYTIRLYCDSRKEHPYMVNGDLYGFPQEFVGTSRQTCYMKAARNGWTLSPKSHICPWCNGKLKEHDSDQRTQHLESADQFGRDESD